MISCPIVTRYFCLKWRRVVITLIFGIVFIFATINIEENNQVNDNRIGEINHFDNSYTNDNIDIVHGKILLKMIENNKYKDLQNLIPTQQNNKISFKDNEMASYEKLHHPSVIKKEYGKMNTVKSYTKNKLTSHKNSSHIGGIYDRKQKHLCKVPSSVPPLLKQRRDRAIAACKRLQKHLPRRWRMRHIRWGKQLNIVYCHVPKAASTTWSWHLLRAIGLKDDLIAKTDNVHNLLKKHLPYPSVEDARNGVLDSALKFLVTRHPFERLVSAYQNKIADPFVEPLQYREVQKKIISQYYGDLPVASQPLIPSFRDFCRYVIEELEEWMHDSDKNGLHPPDHHWSPQTYICSPCKLKYDVFSDMSTLDWDTAYIAQQCGLGDVIGVDVQLNQSPGKPSIQSPMNTQLNQSPIKPIIQSSMNAQLNQLPDKEISQSLLNISNIILKQNQSAKNMHSYNKIIKKENNKEIHNKLMNITNNEKYIYGDNTKNGPNEVELSKNAKYKGNIYKDYFNQLSEREIKHLNKLYRFDFEIFGYDVQEYLTY